MPISARPHRPFPLLSFSLLLTACGGGSGAGSSPGPEPGGPGSQQLSEANSAGLRSMFDPATNRVSLQWQVNVTGASRYQIEQQDPSGEWVVIDGVWAPPVNGAQLNSGLPQYPQWTGVMNGATTYRVEAVVPGGTVPLGLAGAQGGTPPPTSIAVSAPTPLPSIELDQPEPLETPVEISVVGDGTYEGGTLSIDTPSPSISFSLYAPSWTITVDPASYTTGTHLIYATMSLNAASAVVIRRSVTVHTSRAALGSINILQTTGSLNINLVATSDSGIVSVVAMLDGVVSDTVTAPNSCVPLPCAAGQPFNAYYLSIDTKGLGPGYHLLNLQVTDSAGNTAYAPQLSGIYIPVPVNATLDSPVEGAVVAGTLHVSGSFSSGTPGPLEVMVTLSGVPVYDTTVANTGADIPYSADVSLAGVTPGYHTLNTYARVGDTNYTQTASALIQIVNP
jgi:hypothetical protein